MSTRLTKRSWIAFIKIVILLLALAWLLVSCKADQYWAITKDTATGRHTYMKASWGIRGHKAISRKVRYQLLPCSHASSAPLKLKTYHRYTSWRPSKRN